MVPCTNSDITAELLRILTADRTRLVRIADKYLHGHDLSEDMVQEASIRAWKHLDQFDGRSLMSSWVCRIVINTCHEHYRTSKSRRRYPGVRVDMETIVEPVAVGLNPEDQCLADERLDILDREIGRLPVIFQMAVVSTEMNQELSTIKVRKHRAIKAMRKSVIGRGL